MTTNNLQNRLSWQKIILFLIVCVFYNLIISHLVSLFATLKQPLKQDTFYNISSLTLVSALVIAPFIEELIFRGFLSTKRAYLFSIPILLPIIFYAFHFNGYALVVVGILSLIFVILCFNVKSFDFIHTRFFSVLVIFSCLSFCLAHIIVMEKYFNFQTAFLSSILVFTPLAYLLAKVRMIYGIVYSILAHSLHNIFMLGLNSLIY